MVGWSRRNRESEKEFKEWWNKASQSERDEYVAGSKYALVTYTIIIIISFLGLLLCILYKGGSV